MAGFSSRLQKIFQAEAHTAVSKLEDPIKLTEQGVRDLQSNLNEAIISLAQIKSVAIRMRKEAEEAGRRANDYERKAIALVQRGQTGELALNESDHLASESLKLKSDAERRHSTLTQQAEQQDGLVLQLRGRIEELQHNIDRYENELITLRARAKTARSVKKINQHLAGANSSDTVALLKRMNEKVAEEEALAEAYGQLGAKSRSIEHEIEQALQPQNSLGVPTSQDSLAELKARMGVSSSKTDI